MTRRPRSQLPFNRQQGDQSDKEPREGAGFWVTHVDCLSAILFVDPSQPFLAWLLASTMSGIQTHSIGDACLVFVEPVGQAFRQGLALEQDAELCIQLRGARIKIRGTDKERFLIENGRLGIVSADLNL